MNVDSRKIRLIMELRRHGVVDTRVLAAMERIPRDIFVPSAFRDQTYENTAVPIGCHQTATAPIAVAVMTQALEVSDRMRVLEIGTGSGYHSVVLSRLARRVYTVERYRDLMAEAEARFRTLGIGNITTRIGDGTRGWPEQGGFERIIVTAAARDVPPVLVSQLAPGGLMIVPVDDGPGNQRLWRVKRTKSGLESEDLGEMRFVPLIADEHAYGRTAAN